MDDPGEDEWEYEYDENVTEDFYITLDLSNAAPTSKASKVGTSALTSAAADAAGRARHSTEGQTTGDLDSTRDITANRTTPSHSNPGSPRLHGRDAIQILDLHTRNPLIYYQGQLLSCRWASTIGSDLLFADAPQDRGSYPEPLRTLPSFDLLGISSTKLVATATQLRPRYSSLNTQEKGDTPGVTQAIAIDDGPPASDTVNIPSTHDAPKAQKNQINFLSRLNAAKAKRGEKDRAPAAGYKKSIGLDETDWNNIQSGGEDTAVGYEQNMLVDYEAPAWSQAHQDDAMYGGMGANDNENRGTRLGVNSGISTGYQNGASSAPSALVHQLEVEMGKPPNDQVYLVHTTQSRPAEDDVVMSESNG